MIEKFKTLFFVKCSLISLYLALTIPIPFISGDNLKIYAIFTFLLGLFLIINITNDYVNTCDEEISYNTSFISNIFGKKSWKIYWKDIKYIQSYQTSQGSNVHYFVTHKGEKFLIPQRISKLDKFIEIITEKTKLNLNNLSYISPLWTYKLLTLISIFMIIGEILSFTI